MRIGTQKVQNLHQDASRGLGWKFPGKLIWNSWWIRVPVAIAFSHATLILCIFSEKFVECHGGGLIGWDLGNKKRLCPNAGKIRDPAAILWDLTKFVDRYGVSFCTIMLVASLSHIYNKIVRRKMIILKNNYMYWSVIGKFIEYVVF